MVCSTHIETCTPPPPTHTHNTNTPAPAMVRTMFPKLKWIILTSRSRQRHTSTQWFFYSTCIQFPSTDFLASKRTFNDVRLLRRTREHFAMRKLQRYLQLLIGTERLTAFTVQCPKTIIFEPPANRILISGGTGMERLAHSY